MAFLQYPIIGLLALLSALAGTSMPTQAEQARPSIVLIIDDLGYNWPRSKRALSLHGAVTYGVLPHTPYSRQVAEQAQRYGKEIIVHVPMSSVHRYHPGPGSLSENLSRQHFVQVLNSNLQAVPHARGANNHMGSALTQNESLMSLLMQEIGRHELYFIDSRTSVNTVAASMAGLHNIKHLSRDVFLDNEQETDAIHRQFQRLLRVARQRGVAVGIGHPHRATLDYLEVVLPVLESSENVRLISGSEAIAQRYPAGPGQLALKLGK